MSDSKLPNYCWNWESCKAKDFPHQIHFHLNRVLRNLQSAGFALQRLAAPLKQCLDLSDSHLFRWWLRPIWCFAWPDTTCKFIIIGPADCIQGVKLWDEASPNLIWAWFSTPNLTIKMAAMAMPKVSRFLSLIWIEGFDRQLLPCCTALIIGRPSCTTLLISTSTFHLQLFSPI